MTSTQVATRNAPPAVYRPHVHARYGTTKSIVQGAAKELGGAKQLAHLLNVSLSRAHQLIGTNEPYEPSFSQLLQMIRAGGHSIVHALCAVAGGTFMPCAATDESIARLTVRAITEHAEFSSKVVIFIQDGLTRSEQAELLREADEAIQAHIAARMKIAEAETID